MLGLAHARSHARSHAGSHAHAHALTLVWELLLGPYGAGGPGLSRPAGLGLDLVLELGPLALGPVRLGTRARQSSRARRSAAGALSSGGAAPGSGGA